MHSCTRFTLFNLESEHEFWYQGKNISLAISRNFYLSHAHALVSEESKVSASASSLVVQIPEPSVDCVIALRKHALTSACELQVFHEASGTLNGFNSVNFMVKRVNYSGTKMNKN